MKLVSGETLPLKWKEISEHTRAALDGKLDGLFGWSRSNEVFESLAVDRQQALLLLLRWATHFDRYDPLSSLLNLWRHLYCEGWRRELPGWRDIGGPRPE